METATLSRPRNVGSDFALPHFALMDVTADVAMLDLVLVNAFFVGDPADGPEGWVLVDAGIPGAASRFIRAAEERFGRGARPRAIVMTHAHFDHAGSVEALAEHWDVPVYAHELELPYITGRSAYPPADPTVGGGFMARMSFLYPRGPYDVGSRARALPADGHVPEMPGWRWVFTPGHAPGHVSFFRDADRMLIAGDAFVTTKQESLASVLTQHKAMHGPPAYYTHDWDAARNSVRRLAALHPYIAVTGHGLPMANPRLDHDLDELARHFDELAMPRKGRYVHHPAVFDRHGVVAVPPPVPDPFPKVLLALTVAGAAVATVAALRGRNED
jgi:glyoxylase-like metal-dependent hydrolase (beta-lactamase superfamily II)